LAQLLLAPETIDIVPSRPDSLSPTDRSGAASDRSDRIAFIAYPVSTGHREIDGNFRASMYMRAAAILAMEMTELPLPAGSQAGAPAFK